MSAGAAALLLFAGPVSARASAARAARVLPGDIQVTLVAVGSTSAPQGVAIRFRTTVTNSSPTSTAANLVFELSGLEGQGPPVDFYRWVVTVPGSGTRRLVQNVTSAQWFEGGGAYQIQVLTDGVPMGGPLGFQVTSSTVVVPQFQDVTASAGLTTTLPAPVCGTWVGGAAWADVDGDGDLDLYLPSRTGPARLWVNDGTGHFVDEAVARGVDDGGAAGVGAVFADEDNDGDPDLYVVNHGPNRLYRNDGTGHFTDVTAVAGVGDEGVGPSAAWGDYDGDGRLDLYVVNHVACTHPYTYQPDRLYHNEGNGTFTDVTAFLPAGATAGAGFQASWFDADGDGDQDLYLANDYLGPGPDANHLFRNDGPGPGATWTFTDVSAESGTGYAMNSMGAAIGDYDRDQDLDFAVSNILGNVLARNEGNGTFAQVAGPAGIDRPWQSADVKAVTWGLGFADLNLDGWEDLYVAAGPTLGAASQPNEVFVNRGPTGSFADLTAPSHAAVPGLSRGVAFADYDRDGLIDLYVVRVAGSPVLLRNVTPAAGSHWLEVRTIGSRSNRDGCGARLSARVGSATLVRVVSCGSTGLASGSDRVVHFGLGSAPTVARLVIEWPSGIRQVLVGVAADRLVDVTEPG